MNLTRLFSYFQHGEVFLLARGGVHYPRIFAIHSRINPFYLRNFTFITQETPYSRNLSVPINGGTPVSNTADLRFKSQLRQKFFSKYLSYIRSTDTQNYNPIVI